MAFNRSTAPVYAKGTMDVWMHNPQTGDLEFYSNKIQTSQFQTNVNMGAINAGIGNPTVIQIPDTANITLNLTAANMSLEARALSTGGILSYNGIVPVMENIVANGTILEVSQTPAAGYGMARPYAFIDKDGTAYPVDPGTNQISGFVAQQGQTYCVRYFANAASAQELTISSQFAPAVEVVMIRIPAYSAQGSSSTQGSNVGDFWIWIPRMQFNGVANTDASQTAASTTEMQGTALAYDEAVAQSECEVGGVPALAYMVYMPKAGATSLVEGLVVVGGEISVAQGQTIQLPVKYVINGQLVQPNYGDLSYQSSTSSTATVGATGQVEGVATGSCEITATLAEPALSVVCNCTVTAS